MQPFRPIELEMESFRSFKDRTIVKFPNSPRATVLISGSSIDGSTSSGTGKSSILIAMAYALGIKTLPANSLKTWGAKKKTFVKLTLTDGSNIYEVIRDPKLTLKVNGEEVGGTSAGAKDVLEELLKTSPELVKTLTYRPQRERGVFINNTDSKNKEFLTKILGLDEIEEAYEKIQADIKSLKQVSDNLNSNLSGLTYSGSVSVSDSQIKEAEALVSDSFSKLEASKCSPEKTTELNRQLSLVREEIKKIDQVKYQVQNAKNQISNIKMQAVALRESSAKASAGKCPTCNQEWGDIQSLINSNTAQLKSLAESLKSNQVLIDNSLPLIDEAHLTKLKELESKIQADIYSDSSNHAQAQQVHSMAVQNLNNLKRSQEMEIKRLKEIARVESELKVNINKTEDLEVCAKILGRQGFLGGIFDEVLAEINSKANDLMSYIPNISTFSLNISSDTVTASGKVNKEIKTTAYKDGEQIDLKTLSGGQISAIELCVDLAIAETVRARTGTSLGWVVLDEALEYLDVDTKIAALDIIKARVDGLLIVVDHSTEIKESFDHVIGVEFDGKRSTIQS